MIKSANSLLIGISVFLVFAFNTSFGQTTKTDYKNPSLPVDERVKDLLSRMTVEEKVAQISSYIIWTWGQPNLMWSMEKSDNIQLVDSLGNINEEKALDLFKYGIGHFRIDQMSVKLGPKQSANAANQLQKILKEKTRLGIPAIFHEEGYQGIESRNGTTYCKPIGLGSTWNTGLVEKVYAMTAKESRVRGYHQILSPLVDVIRDPRFGRVEEFYSEDPYLVSQMGLACIFGYQGRAEKIDTNHVIATLKTFVHGFPQRGKFIAPMICSERELRETFLYPFKVGIEKGKCESLMASYNEVDGVPAHANKWLLQDILRKEWGFKGVVVSDYTSVKMLVDRHHIAENYAEAAKIAINAGVDIELPLSVCYPNLIEMVKKNEVSIEMIDRSASRILRHKFMLGLFEETYVNPDVADDFVGSDANRKIALEVARESIILLKNENNTLPLQKSKIKNLAVIGPNADAILLGGYSYPKHTITVLEGIKNKVGKEINVSYSEGCRLTAKEGNWYRILSDDENKDRISEAEALARKSDMVILVLGANEHLSAEGIDKSTLDLVGAQNKLVETIHKTGKPVVVLLLNGSPMSTNYISQNMPALVECWYPGQEGGTAVADVLFGDYNPSGKLPATVPNSVGQLPIYYNMKPTAIGGYIDNSGQPLYPFGFGLSYTTFGYSNMKIEKPVISRTESVKITCDLTNTGKIAGAEVAQLYITDSVATVTRPVIALKDFKKVFLKPGETKKVEFELTPESLSFWNMDMKFEVEPGVFGVFVGASCVDLKLKGSLLVKK